MLPLQPTPISKSCTKVTYLLTDERTLTYHYHPKSMVYPGETLNILIPCTDVKHWLVQMLEMLAQCNICNIESPGEKQSITCFVIDNAIDTLCLSVFNLKNGYTIPYGLSFNPCEP